ncbi:MAG: FAD-dependent oxidoreductase [Spirochaetota bacterium]
MARYCIVGGVAGGATAAARLRRLDEHAEILLFERGEHVSFANCGLPYHIGRVISDRDTLFLMTPEKLSARLNIDVRVRNEVVGINRSEHTVTVRKTDTGEEYTEHYDRLILSPGAEPLRPPIQGISAPGIYTLRNVGDMDAIIGHISEKKPRQAVIVGAGFIGLEMAENLHHLGMRVTIVEMAEQVMAPIDYEMAAQVHQHLKTKGVEFYLGDGVSSFGGDGKPLQVNLNSGRSIDSDLVILSIGVRPDSKLARDAGLDTTERGAILVNGFLQTNDQDIYAIGDAIAFPHPVTGKPFNTLLAGPANRQGRIVADNIVRGNVREYHGAINTAIAKVFDITVASTGLAEKNLQDSTIPFVSNIIHVGSHSGYYPGAIPMTLKLIFNPENGRVLGAQAIGYEGVDKRIDLIASVLSRGGTVYDLQEIEHAYAPPYASAKDPVNISGYAAENIMAGMLNVISWEELKQERQDEIILLDVRTPEEAALERIDGSVNIEIDSLRDRLDEIPRGRKIIVYCQVGTRGYFAARILMQHGFERVYNLSGGIKTYQLANQKQSNEDIFSDLSVGKDDIIVSRGEDTPVSVEASVCVDACGLQCPGPIMQLKRSIDRIVEGETLLIRATDPGFRKDAASWCTMTGNTLISISDDKGVISALVKKGGQTKTLRQGHAASNKTLVVFSDDFDRALASFVIANGAASTGKKVTMFFTFWGLNLLKKTKRPHVKKDLMGRMFAMMLPKSSRELSLSKLNMMGMGTRMMRMVMKNKRIDSLEDMMRAATESGITMMACQMSMDVMGVKKEELFDFVEIGGVATYLEAAEESNLNLFI